jgi:hypothetical protein
MRFRRSLVISATELEGALDRSGSCLLAAAR